MFLSDICRLCHPFDLDLAGDALYEQIFNEVQPLKIAG
jgi:hypothetical protein